MVVAPDVRSIDAELTFDVASRVASAHAVVSLVIEGPSGKPALDLRQQVDWIRLDDEALSVDAFSHHDIGGGPQAEMRVLDVELEPGAEHRLELGYRLSKPDSEGSCDIDWRDGGVSFDLWMSDLYPGRYLEMWVPAPLCHDRFALRVELRVIGTERPHVLVANSTSVQTGPLQNRWLVRYPANFTSLSPMLVLAPADTVKLARSRVDLVGRQAPLELLCARGVEVDADLEAVSADMAGWLAYLAARYGPWVHGDTFSTFLWEPGRGMEYDGATTASVPALEHEVFHSWFGRGVKPARASDGWIDEAWTSWATASRRVEMPRFASEELGLEEEPVLLCPPHPWSRRTPVESYRSGARLFAGVAHLLGGPDRLRSAMASWYRANAGKLVSTEGLLRHLSEWSGVDLSPWWHRYVYGGEPPPLAHFGTETRPEQDGA